MTRRARGFTAVELMMSLAVLTIGVSGIVAMQKVTIVSNQHAKNLTIARSIAEGWADALLAESALWNSQNDLNETTWLNLLAAGAGNELVWFRPPWSAQRQLGAGFDALGAPIQNFGAAVFCTDLRLAYIDRGLNQNGAGAIRAEIRVAWRREGARTASPPPANFCAGVPTPADLTARQFADAFHLVYLTTVVTQEEGSL